MYTMFDLLESVGYLINESSADFWKQIQDKYDNKYKINKSIKNFITKHSGKRPKNDLITVNGEQYEVRTFFSLNLNDVHWYIERPMTAFIEKTNCKYIPIAIDSGDNYYCADNNTGKVYYWSSEVDELHPIADSVKEFERLCNSPKAKEANTIESFISNNQVDYNNNTIDKSMLKQAEKAVSVRFGKELTEYLLKYGYLGYKHVEFFGINRNQGLESDLVKQTQYVHEQFPATSDLVAIENQGEGDYYLVDSSDNVYEYDTNVKRLRKTGNKLFDHILQRFTSIK